MSLLDRFTPLAIAVYSRLPKPLRIRAVRTVSPTFTAGTQAMLLNDKGQLLLLQTSYNVYWALPGGLLGRNEEPHDAAVRETFEETGLRVELTSKAFNTLAIQKRHFNFAYHARILPGGNQVPRPHPPEIIDLGWFDLDDLPPLDPETLATLVEMDLLPPK